MHMTDAKWGFCERDLLYLVNHFMPNRNDKERVIRILQDDEDILQSMVEQPELSEALLNDVEPVLRVSPYFYFAVLLYRAREDLKNRPYTFEKDSRRMMVVFDTNRILELLSKKRTLIYLARMLASFTRIRSHTVITRVREGIWRRIRFSDFDVESLITYGEMTDEEYRFPIYKRIADICLFTLGIYACASTQTPTALSPAHRRRTAYAEYGPHFYRTASKHREAERVEMRETLEELAESFDLATKPLAFMADHYIMPLRTKFFSLPEEE